jgi:predicted SAM-dependent methyltransferase
VICSHVLEHIEDDATAMTELRRITAPAGWCMVMVPLDLSRSVTYEDWSITSPEERERDFWQHDHVRVYASDIADRLTSAGFAVERVTPRHEFGDRLVERCRILDEDQIFLCRADTSSPS